MYRGRPARESRICRYSPSFSHRSSIFGSACGRLAFIEKSGLGRLTVRFRSTFFLGGGISIVPVCGGGHRVPESDNPDAPSSRTKTRYAGAKLARKCAKMLSSMTSEVQVKPYRVLVCDDQPDVLEALRLLLKGQGWQAIAVDSPVALMHKIRS